MRGCGRCRCAERDQRDRQEQEAEAEAAQQDGRHHVVRAAFAGRAGQHPHRHHDQEDAEWHGGERRNAASLDEERGEQQRADEQGAARQQQQSGVGRRERENGHRKGRDQEGAAEQCGAGDETDDEGEAEIIRAEQVKSSRRWPWAITCWPRNASSGAVPSDGQPDDARLIEPVPAAALAEDIGEAE